MDSELAGEIADKGFFRLLVPRSLDGAELGHLDYLRIIQIFAEADGSTAWCINQNNVFAISSVMMPEQTAREIWGDGRAVVANGIPTPSVKAIPVVVQGIKFQAQKKRASQSRRPLVLRSN